jgi:hypothetical protein
VWHRSPERPWTIWSDRPPLLACPRYFGSALETAALTEISVEWNGPSGFTVAVPRASLTWTVRLNTTPASWMMNAMAALMPGSLWRDERVLRSMGSMAATFLRAGNVGLLGTVPNGQRFHSKPMRVWVIGHTLALSRFDIAADAPVSATWPSGPAYGSDRERLAG